jgi:hypothetical protein
MFPRQRIHDTKKNHWTRRILCGPCCIKGESMGLSLYPPIVARQWLCKHVPAATKNCWKRRFLCGPCRIKEGRRLVLPRTSCCFDFNHSGNNGGRPCSAPGEVMWNMRWTKWHWSGIYLSISVSPVNSHSTNFSTFVNRRMINAV